MLTIVFNPEPFSPISALAAAAGQCSLPVKINERSIIFKRLDRLTVTLDPDFGEPIGDDIFSATLVEAMGQINLGSKKFKERANTLSGDEETVQGHCVFRVCDLIDAGLATLVGSVVSFVLKKGDRIVKLGARTVDFEVLEIRTESPLQGDFKLAYVVFGQATEQRRGVPRR